MFKIYTDITYYNPMSFLHLDIIPADICGFLMKIDKK